MGSSEGTFDTKLHEAVRYGDIEEVKVALQQGYDPNLIGLYQWSALHEAAHNGETEILKLLLGKKGNPNKADYLQSRTAMHYAAEQGHVECLRMLVEAGGRYDIKDANGKDSLDLVTPGGRKILERLKVRDLMQMSPQGAQNTALESVSDKQSLNSSHEKSYDQSVSRRSSQDSAIGEKKPGHVTMSVEYHSSKGTMKIRVWQLSDLLLPPPNTSMIHTIYIKSYLYPDKKKESKRKTEEVKVEGSEGHMHLKKRKDKLSVQHVFTPVSFKFNKALEYSGISADIIKEKQLQIDVCITQRYSHRSFLIGMLLLPLKSAVKKVVKEKYALIPCMNHTIPINMRVYSASQLEVSSNTGVFYSNPNVRVIIPEDIDDSSEKAVSNPDLKREYSSSIEVNMSDDSKVVPQLDFSNLTLDESGYSSEHQVTVSSELESPDSDKSKDIIVETKTFKTSSKEDNSGGKVNELFKPVKHKVSPRDKSIKNLNTCQVIEIEFGDSDSETPREIKIDQGKRTSVEEFKYKESKQESVNKDGDRSGSRPDTPSWDYYDIPIDSPAVVVESPPQEKKAAPVLFPMETTLEVRALSNEPDPVGKNKKEKDKYKRKSKKNQEAIPGKAVPLVPQIVVVSPEENLEKEKCQMTKVNIPDQVQTVPNVSDEGETKGTMKNISDQHKDTKVDIPDKFQTVSKAAGVGETRVLMKEISDSTAVQKETVNPILREVNVVKPKIKKLNVAKFFIPKMREADIGAEKEAKPQVSPSSKEISPHAPPRSKKTRKHKEKQEKEVVLTQTIKDITETDSHIGTTINSAPVLPTYLKNPDFQRSNSENSAFSRSISSTSNSSVTVDIDKLSFASSDSHIVELEEDISITELPEDSDLFSDDSELFSTSSKTSFSTQKDLEKGMEDLKAMPERFSPTKQVLPMQVFIEECFDNSDEALSHSYTKNLPITEL